MKITVRHSHMKYLCNLEVGQEVFDGDIIGVIGNTGASNGAHNHTDCVNGWIKETYSLADMENLIVVPNFRQLMYFIDDTLYRRQIRVEATPVDLNYFNRYGKVHNAFDTIPFDFRLDRDFSIYYNRSKPGKVLSKGCDRHYGNYVHIGLEV